MFDESEPRPHRGAVLTALAREDLDLHSIEELGERIAALETEIVRARQSMERKASRKSAADALFNFKG